MSAIDAYGYTYGVLITDERLDPTGPLGRRIIAREMEIMRAWQGLGMDAAQDVNPFLEYDDSDEGDADENGIAYFEPFAN